MAVSGALFASGVKDNLRDHFFENLGDWFQDLGTVGYESAILVADNQKTTDS